VLSKSCSTNFLVIVIPLLCVSSFGGAQQAPPDQLAKVLERLDQLEKQNQDLLNEIHALRQELRSAQSGQSADLETLQEKAEVASHRIDEQAQTKVQASQRFPVSLTGMFLFDAFLTKNSSADATYSSTYENYSLGSAGGGVTLRQSIFGLTFGGPEVFAGGHVNGFLSMDFYGSDPSRGGFRIRRGAVTFDWKRRSITFGQDKSILSPFQPDSYARVGTPPAAGAGNLWLWRPQVTYEERIPLTERTTLALQASLFETNEYYTVASLPTGSDPIRPRPAVQAHARIRRTWSDNSRFEAGFGADSSTSHVLGQSVPSRLVSADFLIKPAAWIQISGTLITGKNFANLGGVPGGVSLVNNDVRAVRGSAGWAQLAFPVTSRLTFNVYGGVQANNPQDLTPYAPLRTHLIASNVMYRIAPNVVLSFEGAQYHLDEYWNGFVFPTTRYDATVAYLF